MKVGALATIVREHIERKVIYVLRTGWVYCHECGDFKFPVREMSEIEHKPDCVIARLKALEVDDGQAKDS